MIRQPGKQLTFSWQGAREGRLASLVLFVSEVGPAAIAGRRQGWVGRFPARGGVRRSVDGEVAVCGRDAYVDVGEEPVIAVRLLAVCRVVVRLRRVGGAAG